MSSNKFANLAACIAVLSLGACTNFNLDDISIFQKSQGVTGPDPLIDPDSFEKIDLALLLNSNIKPAAIDKEAGKTEPSVAAVRDRLEKAFQDFDEANSIGDATRIRRARNRVQERIIAASNQRCGEYKNFVKQFDSATNLLLGGLTTTVAGAGAIFTNLDTVRALSGVAAIFSGLRAEVNEAYFQNLTIQVITDAFGAKRRETYAQIAARQKDNLVDYSVEKAVGDAIVYHAQCSLIAGLEHAALSIQRAENPGLVQINNTLDTLSQTRRKLDVVSGETLATDKSAEAGAALAEIGTMASRLKTYGATLQASVPKMVDADKAGSSLTAEAPDPKADKYKNKPDLFATELKAWNEGDGLVQNWNKTFNDLNDAKQTALRRSAGLQDQAVNFVKDQGKSITGNQTASVTAAVAFHKENATEEEKVRARATLLNLLGAARVLELEARSLAEQLEAAASEDRGLAERIALKNAEAARIGVLKGKLTDQTNPEIFTPAEAAVVPPAAEPEQVEDAEVSPQKKAFLAVGDEAARTKLQAALCVPSGAEQDGLWGEQTQAAIMRYQEGKEVEDKTILTADNRVAVLAEAEAEDKSPFNARCESIFKPLYEAFKSVGEKGKITKVITSGGKSVTTEIGDFEVTQSKPDLAKRQIMINAKATGVLEGTKDEDIKAGIAKGIIAAVKADAMISWKQLMVTYTTE